MTIFMQFIRLNAGKAVVACPDCVHGLMIPVAWNGVDSIASLACFGIAHFHRALEATVFWVKLAYGL